VLIVFFCCCQARLLHPQLPIDCLVSLGCGAEPPQERSKGLSAVSHQQAAGRTLAPASRQDVEYFDVLGCGVVL
jgi:hypothetical protein